MLENFMLSAHIYPETGDAIKQHLKNWNKAHETEYCWSTNKYKNKGFLNIRVYDYINKSNRRICFLTMTINPKDIKINKFYYGNYGYQMSTGELYNYISKDFIPVFKKYPTLLLRNLKFSISLIGADTSMYMKLLRMGFSLDSWNMQQKIFINDTDAETVMCKMEDLEENIPYDSKYILHHKSESASFNIAYHKGKTQMGVVDSYFRQPDDTSVETECLHVELIIRKYKIQNLMKKYGIKNRKIYDFSKNNFLKKLENQLFLEYIGRITRKGTYYKFKEASQIIEKSKLNKDKKRRLIEVLLLINENNGIDNFIKLASAGQIKDYNKISTIEEYFRNYEHLGINPVLLPDGYPKSSLKNPLTLLDGFYNNPMPYEDFIKPNIPEGFEKEDYTDCPY